jgi:hypothetical protein
MQSYDFYTRILQHFKKQKVLRRRYDNFSLNASIPCGVATKIHGLTIQQYNLTIHFCS